MIDDVQVQHIATLARLKLSDAEPRWLRSDIDWAARFSPR